MTHKITIPIRIIFVVVNQKLIVRTVMMNCRFSFAKLFQFYCLFLPFAIPAIIGVEQSGYSFYLWGWVIMAIVFFGFWEIYILCSHCPFYALNDGLIVCIANFGCPQFWRYQPGPISKSKKIQLVIGGASVPTFLHIAFWIAFLLWGVVQIQVYKVCQFFLCF